MKTGSLWPGVLYHFVHNGLSVLIGRLPVEWIDSSLAMKLVFVRGAEPGELSYRPLAALMAALLAAAILWWFKSLPYHRSAEKHWQEALDQSPAPLPAASAGYSAS